jgi:hypothetical protein
LVVLRQIAIVDEILGPSWIRHPMSRDRAGSESD